MPPALPVTRTIAHLRRRIATYRAAGERIALVPTMGALHDGHLGLVRLAKRRADRAVVSIFINPRQFAANEDLDRYPRNEESDVALLAGAGADLAFIPAPSAVYPPGFSTEVRAGGGAEGLESATRPGFLDGVATVVTKLLLQALPDVAIFGEKDYQQLHVVRQLVRDLDIPVCIVGAPTKRAPDGLALSSRNAYLSADERSRAPALHAALRTAAAAIAVGAKPEAALSEARRAIAAAGFRVDYVELRDAETLAEVALPLTRPARLLAAAVIGRTRLIDNVAVRAPASKSR